MSPTIDTNNLATDEVSEWAGEELDHTCHLANLRDAVERSLLDQTMRWDRPHRVVER